MDKYTRRFTDYYKRIKPEFHGAINAKILTGQDVSVWLKEYRRAIMLNLAPQVRIIVIALWKINMGKPVDISRAREPYTSLSPATVSAQLHRLKHSGLVKQLKDGRFFINDMIFSMALTDNYGRKDLQLVGRPMEELAGLLLKEGKK